LAWLICDSNHLPLSDLYAASQMISDAYYKWLGPQTLLPQTIVIGNTVNFSSSFVFGGINTVFTVSKNGASAIAGTDYTNVNGVFTFLTTGTYQITMTNAAIESHIDFPAKVIAEIIVNPFVPISNISGVPTTATINTPLTLTGTVEPSNATNQTIKWSVEEKGTTGAVITGNQFFALNEGTAIITATITNGTAIGTDYKQSFFITVSTVGISTITNDELRITVFPNPTSGKIVVSGQLLDVSVEVYDIIGKLQESRISEIGKSEIVLDISHLANGLYFLKVDNRTIKIIKQ